MNVMNRKFTFFHKSIQSERGAKEELNWSEDGAGASEPLLCWNCLLWNSILTKKKIFPSLFSLFTQPSSESLFQPVFSRSKHSQSPMHSAGMRFSTFGHLESSTPSPPLPPPPAASCPTHSMRQLSMSHQHSHHHHYHHLHSSTNPMSNVDEMDASMGTIGTINSKEKAKKFLLKKDEAALMTATRSAGGGGGESRKSAPDVIIIAGCNTSHWRTENSWIQLQAS